MLNDSFLQMENPKMNDDSIYVAAMWIWGRHALSARVAMELQDFTTISFDSWIVLIRLDIYTKVCTA